MRKVTLGKILSDSYSLKNFWFLGSFGFPNSSTYPECFHSGSEHIHSVLEWIHTVPEYIHSGVTFLIVPDRRRRVQTQHGVSSIFDGESRRSNSDSNQNCNKIGPWSGDQRRFKTGQISQQSFQEHICHPSAMPGQHVHQSLHFPWRKHAIQHYVKMY